MYRNSEHNVTVSRIVIMCWLAK